MTVFSILMLGIPIFAEGSSVFITAIAPIVTGVIGAVFTYLGLRLNHKAKQSDMTIANQAQQYEGISMGQQFMKDALAESKELIAQLRLEIIELKESRDLMMEENETLKRNNLALDQKIRRIEDQLKKLKKDDGDTNEK